MENVLKTARSAATARPVTTATGRFVRLGTVRNSKSNLLKKRKIRNPKKQKIILSHSPVLD
jgi:hypothetical protein